MLQDEQHVQTSHLYSWPTNEYNHAIHDGQGSIRQYSSDHSQSLLHHQDSHIPPIPNRLEYAAIRAPAQHSQKPIVIPATAASLGSPFLRAYPPSLEAFQIQRGEFLEVLDGLNRVAVQSPPLQVLGLVGDVIGAVPEGTAQAVGLTIKVAADIGRVALSKGATEAYLRKVNKEIFAPRGLKMEIAKLEAVARINNLPILDAKGKIRDDAQLLQPLLDLQQIQKMGVAQRWLQALESWIQPLDLEALPPINMDDTGLWGRLHTTASERERKNSEKKRLKDRTKAFDKHQKEVDEAEEKRAKELSKLEKREQRILDRGHGHRVDDRLRRIDQRREKVEVKHQDRMEKVAEDSRTKDKEAKAIKKVLWLMIRNIDEKGGSGGL
ncbi:hypothetical protein F4860DRAFT_477868 [Xylaria cubensis]|nr:hypothetical protein F4860DRAFT_477868 [Xylaria cubensis]